MTDAVATREHTPPDRRLLTGRPEAVAPLLLGSLLMATSESGTVVVRVDEVEAYAGPGQDAGSHAHRGPRPRNATMFGLPGSLYVYFTYGMHWCANVVVHPADGAGAVLVRAGEVVDGLALARSRRQAVSDRDLARGPARLTRALGIDGTHDGVDLLEPSAPVRLVQGAEPAEVAHGPRVGVAGQGALTPWRWWVAQSRHVSAYRAASRRPPGTAGASRPADP